ncbi:MAG: PEP-CTERM sorting domain-containing protein [Betaproteobacteria bacterium]|nr:PEP-CTERM sorting domain-containing protein [Betaproteobacteria bacterium]
MNKKWLCSGMLVLCTFLAGPRFASANVTQTLGQQHFADGATVTTGAFLAAGAGGTAPFNGIFIGSDVTGPNFSASWTFSYGAVPVIAGASLELGIYDHDSSAAGNQVASFTLNGIDLTAALNTLFEAHGGANAEYDVYTLTLPATTFAQLATGTATVALALQGPGLGILGSTQFNGAALDFSTLNIATQVSPVPEPQSLALFVAGFAVLIAVRRKVIGPAAANTASSF